MNVKLKKVSLLCSPTLNIFIKNTSVTLELFSTVSGVS